MTTILNTIEAPPRYIANDPRPSLIGMTRDALADALAKAGVPDRQRRMRAGQIWHWLYHRGVQDFAEMSNIAKELRQRLDEEFIIGRPEIVTEQVSNDGTRKWLLRLAPDERGARHEVEMVYIPEADRGTLCISSPGRLHAHLHLLPHRHAEAGAQPHRQRDRGAGDDGARWRQGLARPTSRPIPRRRWAGATSPMWC